MGKLNKAAPKIFISPPLYSTKFYGEEGTNQYDIILLPNALKVITDRSTRLIENTIPDDERLAEYLKRMIYLNEGIFPGLIYPDLNIEDCLNYHFSKFEGDKSFFIKKTQEYLTTAPYNDRQSYLLTDAITKEILAWCDEKKKRLKPGRLKLTHRHEALIYKYKVEAKYIDPITPAEMEERYGPKRKQAFYTVWQPKGKMYRCPTTDELNTIVPYLSEYPNAKKAAENDLYKLTNSI